MKLSGTIEKFEAQADGSVIIEGTASSEILDGQGEIAKADALRDAIPGFMRWANIREMHEPSAVGTALKCSVSDDGKTSLRAKIVDSEAVKKVLAGVYKGFSIGGRVLAKSGNAITRLILSEISIVDRPTNPECSFAIAKCDTLSPEQNMTPETLAKVEALPGLIEGLIARLDVLEKRPAPAAPDLTAFNDKITKLEGAITATQAATEANLKNDVIAKMANEGRAPINPETNIGYKVDELAKLDLGTLKLLAANSPIVPLKSRTLIAKSDAKAAQPDTAGLTGAARTQAIWDAQYPDRNSVS